MNRVLMIILMLTLVLMISSAVAQSPPPPSAYQWGLQQQRQTSVAVQPFPDLQPRPLIRPRLNTSHGEQPTMRPIRKVTLPQSFPILMPAPLMPIQSSVSSPSIYMGLDAAVKWQKTSISLHKDQLGLNGTRAVGEFGVSITDPSRFKVRYSLTTAQNVAETLTPSGPLMIGAAEFVRAQASVGQAAPVAGAAAAGQPIKLDWLWGPSHRIDAICLRTRQGPQNFWLSPAFVGNWLNFSITGTSGSNGTALTGTETFNGFFWGGGLEAVYQYPQSRIAVLAVGSDKYALAEANLAWSIGNALDVTAGYSWKQVKAERDITIREAGPSAGLLVRW